MLTAVVFAIGVSGCTYAGEQNEPEPITSSEAATMFKDTCLAYAKAGGLINKAFDERDDFVRLDRPQPGPGAYTFVGPNVTGRVQRIAKEGTIARRCGIYAEVTDLEALHDAIGNVVSGTFGWFLYDNAPSQAAGFTTKVSNGRRARVISSRLKQTSGTLHAIKGNAAVTLFMDDAQ